MAITDPHLWLEDIRSDRSLSWITERNAETRRVLETPRFQEIRTRFEAILTSDESIPALVPVGKHYYHLLKNEQHPRGMWRRCLRNGYQIRAKWETVLDLDALDAHEQQNWLWRGMQSLPPNHRYALIALTRGNLDAAEVREFDLETLTFVDGGFFLPEAISTFSWVDENTLLVETEFGPDSLTLGHYPRTVKRLKRGQTLEQAETLLEIPPHEGGVRSVVTHEAGLKRQWLYRSKEPYISNEMYLIQDDQIIHLDKPDTVEAVSFQEHIMFWLRTDWTVNGTTYPQGTFLATHLGAYLAGARDFTVLFSPNGRTSLQPKLGHPNDELFTATRNYLILEIMDNVETTLQAWRYEQGTWTSQPLPVPAVGALKVQACNPFENDDFLVLGDDFVTPTTLCLGSVGKPLETLQKMPTFFDGKTLMVQQLEAISKDGTAIPYFIVRHKDTGFTKSNPTLLYAYGGFAASLTPKHNALLGAAWLERGGVFVQANIRGGNEFGPNWHRQALRENRQRVFDDFIAVAEDLCIRNITSRKHLGIYGQSNGGLLVGAVMTQHPELFGAVVSEVPVLDMRRYHLLLAGHWAIPEYGDPDNPEDWAFLKRYSPYHTLRTGIRYPPALFITSTTDDRVSPGHARKMTARMLEEGHTVLFLEEEDGGHHLAANLQQVARVHALKFEFLWQHLSEQL
jgi:prolyl oligopeptidase